MSVAVRAKKINMISYTTKLTQVKINADQVGKIRMVFQRDNFGGHMGARKFWRTYLPTLKFYNIDLPMEVVRVENTDKTKEVPCVMEILNTQNAELAKIDMRNLRSEEIADLLLKAVPHTPVSPEEIIEFIPKLSK